MDLKRGFRRVAIVLGILNGIRCFSMPEYYGSYELFSFAGSAHIFPWPPWLYGWVAGLSVAWGVATWAMLRIAAGVLSWVVTGFRPTTS